MPRLLRVISLDPNLGDVRRLRDCLSRLDGWRVSVQRLSKARDVIDRLPKMRADVLFIDEDLERATGVETIRALRTAGEMRPIVATAASDCGYLAADLVLAGADGYLAKADLSPEMVGRVLGRALLHARGRTASDRLRRSAVRRMFAERGEAFTGLE